MRRLKEDTLINTKWLLLGNNLVVLPRSWAWLREKSQQLISWSLTEQNSNKRERFCLDSGGKLDSQTRHHSVLQMGLRGCYTLL